MGKKTSGANVSVDGYTGTAQVHVPICEPASKQLSIPVSLDYVDGRGVRAQEYASQVGLGWRLNAGGSISRVVCGFPDDQPNGYLGTQQWGQVVYAGSTNPNYESFLANVSSPNIYKLSGENESNNEPIVDGEPDRFYVSTPYFSFQFVFDQNGNPVCSDYTGYKVISTSFINTAAYNNSSFEVIDDKGNQFYFGNTTNSTELATDSIFGQVPIAFITSWYLTKIVSYNAEDAITFTYQAAPNNDITYNYSWMETQNYTTIPAATKTYLSTGKTTILSPRFVSTIVSSLGELDFNYTFSRTDDPNVPYLASIVSKAYNPPTYATSTTLQTYNFSYGYFNSPSTDPNLLRLQLNGITVSGNTASTVTPLSFASFSYNTSASLPNRTLPVFDYWGYCTTMPSPVPPDIFNIVRTPNVTAAQAGILNSITTLLGGTWNIFYELNAFNAGVGGTTNVGGLRVNEVSQKLPTGESLYKKFKYTDVSGNSTGQIYSSNYSTLLVNTSGSTPFNVNFSNSPYTVSDLNGTFVGYSSFTETNQNGGYTVSNFMNFSDYNDPLPQTTQNPISVLYVPTISLGYKRGLLKDQETYNATGSILSKIQNTYTSQTSPVTNGAYGFRVILLPTPPTLGGVFNTYGYYSTQVENYRLTQTVQTDYDQQNPSNTVQNTTTYQYHLNTAPALCLVNYMLTTDSKLGNLTKTVYFPDQTTSIPLATAEQTAITAMVNANRINIPIHETDVRGSATTEVHNSYAVGSVSNNNGFANTYLANTTYYNTIGTTRTQARQQLFTFDQSNSNLLSSNSYSGPSASTTAGKPMAISYGYNSSYSVASVENASSTSTYSTTQTTGTAIIASSAMPGSVSFTVGYTGTITVNLDFAGAHGSSDVTFVSCTLSGPTASSPILCYSSTGTGCSAYGSTATILNAIPGNYTLSATVSSNNNVLNSPYVSCSYPLLNTTKTYTNEFFYEGFEENSSAITGAAHTGNMYLNGNYTVPFTPPNGRSYLIQYWKLSGSTWNFNEVPYTTGMVITGPVDDVRVFPTDALMNTYTYNPLVGKTSQTDPSGKSMIYQYDGLNRLQTIRDQDNNILKQYDYEYQLLAAPAYNFVESGTYTKTNCPPGYNGLPVTLTVPANTYSSYISQLAANQLALNYISANGPNYANAQSTASACALVTTATISITNAAGTTGYSVTLTNTATNTSYSTTLTATGGSLTVPFGTYNIVVTTTLTTGLLVNFCTVATAHTATGSSVTMLAKTVSATGCQSLTVNNDL